MKEHTILARRYRYMKRKKNPINMMILPALALTGILYVLQLWQWIDVKHWIILIPVVSVSFVVILMMLVAGMVALKFRKHNENKT